MKVYRKAAIQEVDQLRLRKFLVKRPDGSIEGRRKIENNEKTLKEQSNNPLERKVYRYRDWRELYHGDNATSGVKKPPCQIEVLD